MREESFYLEDESKIYCEKISPEIKTHEEVIVMIPGGGHSGSSYKWTPDGRQGWGYFFADKGYEVYLPDWPNCGRSGDIPLEIINGEFVVNGFLKLLERINRKAIILMHSASGPFGWKLGELGSKYVIKIIGVSPGPMGNIQDESEIVCQNADDMTVNFMGLIVKISISKPFICSEEFITRKLIGTLSTQFPREKYKEYCSSLQGVPPRLIYERFNIKGTQMKVKALDNYKNIKVLVVTPTEDIQHTKEIDMRIVDFFRNASIRAEQIYLGDKNIYGNGHMFMLEKNNMDIAEVIHEWIASN